MKVRVTQECIKMGMKGEETSCPIALALWDQFQFQCKVKPDQVEKGTLYFKLPFEAKKFIDSFDAGNEVVPFEFDLPPLEEWDDFNDWYKEQE